MFKHFWSVCSMFKYYRNFMCVVGSPIFLGARTSVTDNWRISSIPAVSIWTCINQIFVVECWLWRKEQRLQSIKAKFDFKMAMERQWSTELQDGSCGGSRTCYALVCNIYIAERTKRRGCFPPTGSKHYSFLRLFHPLRPGFQQDYAVAAAASSATWDACCSVQMRLRSPYTLSTRPEHGND